MLPEVETKPDRCVAAPPEPSWEPDDRFVFVRTSYWVKWCLLIGNKSYRCFFWCPEDASVGNWKQAHVVGSLQQEALLLQSVRLFADFWKWLLTSHINLIATKSSSWSDCQMTWKERRGANSCCSQSVGTVERSQNYPTLSPEHWSGGCCCCCSTLGSEASRVHFTSMFVILPKFCLQHPAGFVRLEVQCWSFCLEFACSPHDCVGFLEVSSSSHGPNLQCCVDWRL